MAPIQVVPSSGAQSKPTSASKTYTAHHHVAGLPASNSPADAVGVLLVASQLDVETTLLDWMQLDEPDVSDELDAGCIRRLLVSGSEIDYASGRHLHFRGAQLS